MNSVLVTGGAGFIGSHIVDEALKRGLVVTVLDDFSTGKTENLTQAEGRIKLVRGDVSDPEAVSGAMEGIEAVFHLAALVSVPASVADPQKSARINDLGTLNVFTEAARRGVRRVVFSSSAAVYGPGLPTPHSEAQKPDPVTPYAAHKLIGEHYARFFHRERGLESVCLRYFNVYGNRQDPSSPYSGVISIFQERLKRGEAITIFGDGLQTRDFVHVSDVVAANFLALAAKEADGSPMNVGTGAETTLLELSGLLSELTGRTGALHHGPTRAGDLRHSVAATGLARERLGFKAGVGLKEGLALLVKGD